MRLVDLQVDGCHTPDPASHLIHSRQEPIQTPPRHKSAAARRGLLPNSLMRPRMRACTA